MSRLQLPLSPEALVDMGVWIAMVMQHVLTFLRVGCLCLGMGHAFFCSFCSSRSNNNTRIERSNDDDIDNDTTTT